MGYLTWIVWASLAALISGINVIDVKKAHREKECYGSNLGFSFSGTREFHYDSLRRRYSGCTHVIGNLEVTNLNNGNVTYDLNFLSTIKVVTGYVLLGLLNVETIPLTSLSLISAEQTLRLGMKRFGLVVVLNSWGTPTEENPTPGLRELQLPALKEVTFGDVLITQNPWLCHMDTIAWDVIIRPPGRVELKDSEDKNCKSCKDECVDEDGIPRCWGSGPDMCQTVKRVDCHYLCAGRCFKPGPFGCCDSECIEGCFGSKPTDCLMCRHLKHEGVCITECPRGLYPLGQSCVEI